MVLPEGKLQKEIINFLKLKGAYVIKTKPGMGTPVGCPDIIFLFEGAWGAIEVKGSPKSPYRPGQELTLKRLGSWSPFVWTAHPENWSDIKKELLHCFF